VPGNLSARRLRASLPYAEESNHVVASSDLNFKINLGKNFDAFSHLEGRCLFVCAVGIRGAFLEYRDILI